LGREKISLSKRVKNSVKSAVKFINHFEETATSIAAENGFDYVICGHIHKPEIKTYHTKKGTVTYLNSGDWIENLTALEYHKGKWKIFQYQDKNFEVEHVDEYVEADDLIIKSSKELYGRLVEEMIIRKI
jgi:UDP-2,3-diacylglucosamine pyrophosphatase LpxH